jgi:poly-D-alanine transfer protein DltD
MQKKSQGGMNAAILVAIIAGLIILYIVFLPTSEREKLVEEKATKTATGEEKSNVLLKAFPGMLSTSKGLEDEKEIPNIFLVETTNAKELEKINPFIVRSGWFDKRAKKIDFELEDPDI